MDAELALEERNLLMFLSCWQVSDLCEMNIDTVLKEIAKTMLITLPESGATRVEDMLTLNEVCSYLLPYSHM